MPGATIVAFLNLGPVEIAVIAVVAVLIFGPSAARAMGKVGRTLLGVKKEIEDAKDSLQREVGRVVKDAVMGDERADQGKKPSPKSQTPPKSPPADDHPGR